MFEIIRVIREIFRKNEKPPFKKGASYFTPFSLNSGEIDPEDYIIENYSKAEGVKPLWLNSANIEGKDIFLGLCPFHKERTPSFSVSCSSDYERHSFLSYLNSKYHCFGCSAKGNAGDLQYKNKKLPLFEKTLIFSAFSNYESSQNTKE